MGNARFLIALAFVAFISLGMPDGLLGPSWPSMAETFAVPLSTLGVVVATFTAGYLLSSFFAGIILRILPIGSVLALSTAAAALALLGMAWTPSWLVLVGMGFLAGLGGGAVDAGLNAYGAAYFSTRTLNWLHAFFGVGTTLGPLIVTAVLSADLVWRISYAIVGGAQLLLAVAFFATRHRWARGPNLDQRTGAPVRAAKTIESLSIPRVWLGMLTFFLYSGLELATAQWSFSLMTVSRGIDEEAAGLFVALYWGSLMVGRVLFGFVADRVPLGGTLRLCMAGGFLGAVLFWLEPTRGLGVAGLMLVGFSIAPIFATLISLTPVRMGAAHADSAIGFQIASAGLGGAVVTAAIGVASRYLGLEVIGIAIVLVALALWLSYEALSMWTPIVSPQRP